VFHTGKMDKAIIQMYDLYTKVKTADDDPGVHV